MLSASQVKKFQKKILNWYADHKRKLPWRDETGLTTDEKTYHVLVSEIMLQQTQAERVKEKYNEWLEAFPTIEGLAGAPIRDVLLHWSGLGYNRRALYLQKCAQEVVKLGKWPQSEKELLLLPGIGKYTARALLCFALGEQIAVVDTNIRKVILTEFGNQLSEKEIEEIADKLVPYGKASDWNQALMDYSRDVLRQIKHPRVIKQSAFKNSDRYYRGQTLKRLLGDADGLNETVLSDSFGISYDRYNHILETLVKDNMIVRKNGRVMLK